MADKSVAKSATIIDILVYFDEPQLLLLESDRDNKMLAVAIPAREGLGEYPFFACEVRSKPFEKYMSGKADLHHVFANCIRDNYYTFDLSTVDDGKIRLTVATHDQKSNADFWPEVGFFSRSHTSDYGLDPAAGNGEKEYKIDGKWGPTDFSHFYAKVADLYAIFAVFSDAWKTMKAGAQDAVADIVRKKMWRGGGSYLGFYDQLMDQLYSIKYAALDVKRIQYASPGHLVLRGDPDALADIGDVVQVMREKKAELDKTYNAIYSTLRQERLLGKEPAAKFSSDQSRKRVRLQTDELLELLGLEFGDILYEVSGKKTLVYAKMALSIYRRANEVYAFHDEGRVQDVRVSRH